MTIDDEGAEYAAYLKALGARIKQFRKERGLTLRDMSVTHGYHETQWRRYERGGAASIHSLLKIVKAFGTTVSILLDGLGEYPAPTATKLRKKEPSSLQNADSTTGIQGAPPLGSSKPL